MTENETFYSVQDQDPSDPIMARPTPRRKIAIDCGLADREVVKLCYLIYFINFLFWFLKLSLSLLVNVQGDDEDAIGWDPNKYISKYILQ